MRCAYELLGVYSVSGSPKGKSSPSPGGATHNNHISPKRAPKYGTLRHRLFRSHGLVLAEARTQRGHATARGSATPFSESHERIFSGPLFPIFSEPGAALSDY
jgi:hypothetical protein